MMAIGRRVADSCTVRGDRCLTVPEGRAMLTALDEDYRAVSFIAEEMYGNTRADI
jgi:hypothetical protein